MKRWLSAVAVVTTVAAACSTAPSTSVPGSTAPQTSSAVRSDTPTVNGRNPESEVTPSVPGEDAVSVANDAINSADQLSEWTVVAGPVDVLGTGTVLSDDETLFVVHNSTGTVVAIATTSGFDNLHVLNADWIVQHVVPVADTFIEVATNDREGRTVIYQLEHSIEPKAIMEWGPEHYPEIAVSGSKLWFTSRRSDDVPCITQHDFETQSETDLVCGAPGHIFGWLAAADEELSYVRWTDSNCGTLWHMNSRDPASAAPVSGDACVFHGTAVAGIAAWVEQPISDERGYVDFFHVPGVAVALAANTASTTQLGTVVAGSLQHCGDALYWLAEGNGDHPSELRRWDPASGTTVVYRSPDEGTGRQYATSKPLCSADGRVMLQRAGYEMGALEELLIQGPYPSWFDIAQVTVEIPADPVAFLQHVRSSEELSSWASTLDDSVMLQFAEQVCSELDGQLPDDRYMFLMDPGTEQTWMAAFDLTDLGLWFFRQVATRSICPEHYFLTLDG